MGFARTVRNLTVFFLKCQIPGGSPGGGMIAVGLDSYIIRQYILQAVVASDVNKLSIQFHNLLK